MISSSRKEDCFISLKLAIHIHLNCYKQCAELSEMHVSHNKILYECISLGQQLWQTLISSFPLVQNVIMSFGCINMIPVNDIVEPIRQLHRRHLHDPFSFTNPQ